MFIKAHYFNLQFIYDLSFQWYLYGAYRMTRQYENLTIHFYW
jgi:hypothetical protein